MSNFRCFCQISPVSYTHLDVYKRQIKLTMNPEKKTLERTWQWLNVAVSPSLKPVSYTHLDVYKRQICTVRKIQIHGILSTGTMMDFSCDRNTGSAAGPTRAAGSVESVITGEMYCSRDV